MNRTWHKNNSKAPVKKAEKLRPEQIDAHKNVELSFYKNVPFFYI